MTDFENFANREVISEADARDLRQEGVLAMDPEIMGRSGGIYTVSELAEAYGFTDPDRD